MKKYTDKELAAMTPKELKGLQKKALEELNQLDQQLENFLAKNPIPETPNSDK